MRVILIANTLWNIHNFRQPIIKMLREKGAEVYVSAPFHLSEKDLHNNTKNFIPLKYGQNADSGLLHNLRAVSELKQVFKELKPDLILTYTIKPNILGGIAAALTGTRTIATLTGLGYTFIKGGLTEYFTKMLYRVALRKVSFAVFHNPDDAKLFLKRGIIKKSQVKIIRGSGVNIDEFTPKVPTSFSDKFVFLFIGRILIDKGIREFLTAAKVFEKYSKVEFQIIGGMYPDNPAALTENEWHVLRKKSKNVKWLGQQEDVKPHIAGAKCLVLPSYREGLPMSVLEAMAMGKPVIVTDVPGCRETVEEGKNGYLVEVKSVTSLQNAMTTLYNSSEEELRKLGENGRAKAVKDFSENVVARAYSQIIFDGEKYA